MFLVFGFNVRHVPVPTCFSRVIAYHPKCLAANWDLNRASENHHPIERACRDSLRGVGRQDQFPPLAHKPVQAAQVKR